MKIIIIFPKRFFSKEQLSSLKKFDIKFIEGHDIDLERIPELYNEEPFILSVDPTYLKDSWDALPMERIKRMKGLKSLCLTTTAFGWVNGKELSKLGIILTNTPGKSTEAVAEFNIFMMLSLFRKIPLIVKNNWKMDYDHFTNEELKNLTAGIIGFGKIGSRVAELCRGLGMSVNYWNRSKKETTFKAVELKKLFEKSDVIFNTIATSPELKGFINKDLISKLNKKAIIISTSDTNILDANFILDQVRKDNLGGYAFESIEKKMFDYNGNVAVFPEQAYYTLGTLKNTAKIVTETILSVLKGALINKVN